MSRTSQGSLEVERYIGSCLISSTVRPNLQKTILSKKQEQTQQLGLRNNPNCYPQNNYSPGNEQCQYGTWTGTPLISMTSSPRRSNQRLSPPPCQQMQHQQQQHIPVDQSQQQQQQQTQQQVPSHLQSRSPLSRLAIHTQGAPLILTGRFHNRGKIQNCGNVVTGGANVNNFCNVSNNVGGGTTMPIGRCVPQRGQRTVETSRKFQQQHQHQQQQQQQQHQQQQQLNLKNECQASKAENTSGTNVANIDSLSIASDESSNNSENSLPRIIKPRKRRKKDRKPTNAPAPEILKQDDQMAPTNPDQSSSVTSNSYTPVCYETRYDPTVHRSHRRPPVGRESYARTQTSASMQEIVDTRQRYAHRHVQVKVLDDNRNIVVPAPVRTMGLAKGYRNHHHHHHHHHLINNTVNRENGNNSNNAHRYMDNYGSNVGCEGSNIDLGSCQCRYCDPSGLIWDVEQNNYSPFLTPPPTSNAGHEFGGVQYPQIPLFLSRSDMQSCQEQAEYFDVEDPFQIHHQHQRVPSGLRQDRIEPSNCTLLRRSWSDPTSYFSEQISTPSRDIGVIGDRGQTDVPRGRSSWPGSASSGVLPLETNVSGLGAMANPVTPAQGLEVSTEIVTSLNGHRDLEIKFYSSSPNAVQTEEEKSPFSDDNEDYIWSYHESKLQQDFRTLLQAEE